MTEGAKPTDQLRAGRRAIKSYAGIKLVTDLTWFDKVRAWGILCRITVDTTNPSLVPRETDWWILLDQSYPLGKIRFCPAKLNGIAVTFPHQQYNGTEHPSAPWRMGEICVRSPSFTSGKHSLDPDPIGSTHRLAWYCTRAIEWLEAAVAGNLIVKDDPFELPMFPMFPMFPMDTAALFTVAHCETSETFRLWQGDGNSYGTSELVKAGPRDTSVFAVRAFFDGSGKELLRYGRNFSNAWRGLYSPSCIVVAAMTSTSHC